MSPFFQQGSLYKFINMPGLRSRVCRTRPLLFSSRLWRPVPQFVAVCRFGTKTSAADIASARRARGGPAEDELPTADDILYFTRNLEKRSNFSLPLLVLDSMLPKQRFRFTSDDARLQHLARLGGEVGIIGVSPQSKSPLTRGVTAALVQTGTGKWEFRGKQHVHVINAEWEEEGDEFRTALLEPIEDHVHMEDIEAAKWLPPLVEQWCSLVRRHEFERFQGQLNAVLADLGPMPPVESAGELAFWTAALVNPLPALGVAYEIRPAALLARTVGERIRVVRKGIEESIGHVNGRKPLF